MVTTRPTSPGHVAGRTQPVHPGRSERGFSLTDLLVSIMVMAVLIALLLPVLGGVYESARRVKCQSNLKQIGYAINTFADDNDGMLPPSHWENITSNGGTPYSRPQDTIFVRHGLLGNSPTGHEDIWDGLGILVQPGGEQYLSHPEVLYCPSHQGNYPFHEYAGTWARHEGLLAGNYQYRLPGLRTIYDLPVRTTLVSDAMRSKSDYNHRVGNNMLKADFSVVWFQDDEHALLNQLADNGDDFFEATRAVTVAWTLMDTKNSHAGGPGGGPAPDADDDRIDRIRAGQQASW